ncbi:phosphoethanolamine methyltransferase, partial [bacterium]|nr:phosphoethanolamine methyltransferase [bacterium]
AIVSRESVFTIGNKEQLFNGLETQLKPRGQVLMTDYVLDPKADLGKLERWAVKEPMEPHLWTERDAAEAFAQRNLDLRIAEDITDTHRGLILAALNGFTHQLTTRAMDKETKLHVLEESELWARRVSAFESGLRAFRFYAIKPNIDG